MSDELMRDFHVDGVGLGFLAASFFFAYFVTQLFVGVLIDKFSLRWLSGIAILASSVGVLLFSTTHILSNAEIFRGMMGFGAAFATVCYLKAAAIWFPGNRFAFISGLLATAAMVGAVFGEAPLAAMVDHVGWRGSMYDVGLFGVLLSVLFMLMVRDQPRLVFQPLSKVDKTKVSWHAIFAVMVKPQNWLLAFYSGMTFSPIAVLGGLWGNMFLMEAYHVNKTEAASLISVAFIGLAIGGPVLGVVSDKLNCRKPIMWFGNSVAAVALLLALYWDSMPMPLLTILLFLFGFGVGAFMLGFALGKEINGIVVAATVIALINSGDAIFGAITEPFVGKLLDLGANGLNKQGLPNFTVHDFHLSLLVLPLYMVVATLLLFWVNETNGSQAVW